ncbi:unnamed protein product [Mytilus edulis]|uniref:Uncharacterized protein n=1 Tax=Mytilus edulis TaxID=6550 RepID=A0A8S3RMT5_MYTED|nr:unnamed protein product [Mytilus edulis]
MKSKLEQALQGKEYNRNMQIKMKKSAINVSNVTRIVEQEAHSVAQANIKYTTTANASQQRRSKFHPECITISGNSLTCHSCCNTIERLEPTQDENEQIDTSQTFIKSCELPENEENNPEQSQETSNIRTNSSKRQELHNDHDIANSNQQYAQEKKTNQKNGKKQNKGQTLVHSQLMNKQYQSILSKVRLQL